MPLDFIGNDYIIVAMDAPAKKLGKPPKRAGAVFYRLPSGRVGACYSDPITGDDMVVEACGVWAAHGMLRDAGITLGYIDPAAVPQWLERRAQGDVIGVAYRKR